MPVYQFWRFHTFTMSDYLEICEWQLLENTTNVNAQATITSSAGPISGATANLYDGVLNGANNATWGLVTYPILKWDFGANTPDITGFYVGFFEQLSRFPNTITVEANDTDVWTSPALSKVFMGARNMAAGLASYTLSRVFPIDELAYPNDFSPRKPTVPVVNNIHHNILVAANR